MVRGLGSRCYSAHGKGAIGGGLYCSPTMRCPIMGYGAVGAVSWGTWVQCCTCDSMGAVSYRDIRGAVMPMLWGCIIMGHGAVASMARGFRKSGSLEKGLRGASWCCGLSPHSPPTTQNRVATCKHPKIKTQPERVNNRK